LTPNTSRLSCHENRPDPLGSVDLGDPIVYRLHLGRTIICNHIVQDLGGYVSGREALGNDFVFLAASNGQSYSTDLHTVISIKASFLAAYQAYLLTFVSVFQRAVSDSFPYLSCRPCHPLLLSFSCCPKHLSAAWFIM